MKKINNLGTMTYEGELPAKLIIGDKEINVVVKTIELHTDEHRDDLLKPIILNGIKKYSMTKRYETRLYTCEERIVE